MSEPELIDEAESDAIESAGEILAHERKQLRLSQQDVADQLNLRLDVINAIENDDYEEIPGGETFVRGYIRAYARLVDIDEEDVLEERNYEVEPQSAPRSVFTPVLNRERAPRARRIRKPGGGSKFIVGFAVLIAAIIATWSFSDIPSLKIGQWFSSDSTIDSTIAQTSDAGSADLPVQVNVTRLDTSEFNQQQSGDDEKTNDQLTSSVDETISVTTEGGDQGSPEASDTVLPNDTNQNPATTYSVDTADDSVEASVDSTAQPQSKQVINLTQDVAPTAIAEDVTSETADIQNTLMLETEDASWAEVRDATGQRLLYAMLQPRQARNLTGQAPFDITLGNASTVRIRLDDSAMDISGHIRPGRTAHLRVGKEGIENTR